MTTEQINITKAIDQVAAEAQRVGVQAMVWVNTDNSQRTQNAGPKLGGPMVKQLTFNWSSKDKYAELKNFKMKLKNMFQNYSISQAERVPNIKNCLGRKAPQLLDTHSGRARGM